MAKRSNKELLAIGGSAAGAAFLGGTLFGGVGAIIGFILGASLGMYTTIPAK